MISIDDVESFLEAKEATNKCEACGRSSWGVPSAGGNSLSSLWCDLFIAQSNGGNQIPPLAVLATIVVCTHCGHLRFFSSNLIEKEI